MTDELIFDLLRDMQQTQLANAGVLGGMAADLRTLSAGHKEIREDVDKLQEKNWKQAGFIAGVVFAVQSAGVFVAKKLGWL